MFPETFPGEEAEDAARQLEEALESRDLEALRTAIEDGEIAGLSLEELEPARRVLAEEEETAACKERVQQVTEQVANLVIFANVYALARQVDNPNWEGWKYVEVVFSVFFTLELSIRYFVISRSTAEFFCGADMFWNIFDLFIISLSWASYVLFDLLPLDKKAIANLRMLRMLRILRILRLMKVKELRRVAMYMRGLIESWKVVGWIMVLFVMVIIIFAIITTQLIGHEAQHDAERSSPEIWPADEPELLESAVKQWSTMMKSCVTLFQFLTLDDWSNITRDVAGVLGWQWYLIFTCYVLLNAVIILALLTGVITEHMMQVHRNDDEDQERERQEKLKTVLKAIYRLFKLIDTDNSDSIDRAEFQTLLRFFHAEPGEGGDMDDEYEQLLKDNPDIGEALADIRENLAGLDDPELFSVFDMNGDGAISWDEFRISMEELKKGLTKKQTFKLQANVRKLERDAEAAREIALREAAGGGRPPSVVQAELVRVVGQEVGQVEQKIQSIEQVMSSLENTLKDVVDILED